MFTATIKRTFLDLNNVHELLVSFDFKTYEEADIFVGLWLDTETSYLEVRYGIIRANCIVCRGFPTSWLKAKGISPINLLNVAIHGSIDNYLRHALRYDVQEEVINWVNEGF